MQAITKRYKKIGTSIVILFLVLAPVFVFARGGGGGSSSGGGSGGSGYSSSGGDYDSGSGGGGSVEPACSSSSECSKLYLTLFITYFTLVFILSYKNRKANNIEQSIGKTIVLVAIVSLVLSFFSLFFTFIAFIFAGFLIFLILFGKPMVMPSQGISIIGLDNVYGIDINASFLAFQKAWCEFDIATLERIVTEKFRQQLVLELAVLKNERRENRMSDIKLLQAWVDKSTLPNTTTLRVTISASANDSLYDIDLEKNLYSDTSKFVEFWNFVKEGENWKLDSIEQATANKNSVNQNIADFASINNFFYNPDFGWLMIPNRGNLFSDASFKTSDINNHVIGVYKNKIVEFYSIIFKKGDPEYFIGQAILPKLYNRIIIERKNTFSLYERIPSGLRKIELESIAFNNEFNVYSDNADTMTTFELLHPAFMEYIMGLPYKVNIEVVGNTVYFYTTWRDKDGEGYKKLLEILSRAFDEIKE